MSQKQLRDYAFNFGANDVQMLSTPGNFFAVLESVDDIYISIDNGPFVKRRAGDSQTSDYSQLIIKSLVAQSIVIVAGFGLFNTVSQVVTVNGTFEFTTSNQNIALDDVVIPAGGGAVIAGANVTRKTLVIKALASNGQDDLIRIGTGATAVKGLAIGTGESVSFDTTAAINAFNPSAAPFTVSVSEINLI